MVDKELSYEELPVGVTDVVAVLFPQDHGCHTRPFYAYLGCILLSIGRERVWPSFGMNMLCDVFILEIPPLSSASLIHLLWTCRRCSSGLLHLHPEAYLVSIPLSIGREKLG